MSAITLNPGNVRVVSMRILQPWRGVWLADLVLDPATLGAAPVSGKVTITIGTPVPSTLSGTIAPAASGAFVELRFVRVLGGGAGWSTLVTPRHYHSDGGLIETQIYQTTATEVGEAVHVATPQSIGHDFVRSAGPASRVLEGVDWWIDLTTGVTQVGARPPATADRSLEALSWDPTEQVAELVCDTLLMPNTAISDPRIPSSPVTVRDVEQTFTAEGSRVTAWCGSGSATQLMGDLAAMVREFAGVQYLRSYAYRILEQNADGSLQLQAVTPAAGLPDTLPIAPWTGLAGASAKYLAGSLVCLVFFGGDPTKPIAVSYEPGPLPLESTVDATEAVHVGPRAVLVELAGGATALVPAPWGAGVATALGKLAASLSGLPPAGPLAALTAIGATLTGDLAGLPAGATTRTKAT